MNNRMLADIAFTKSGYPFVNDGSELPITDKDLREAEGILASLRSLLAASTRPDATLFDPERMAAKRRVEDLRIERGKLDSKMSGLAMFTPEHKSLQEKRNAISSEIQGVLSQLAGSDKP